MIANKSLGQKAAICLWNVMSGLIIVALVVWSIGLIWFADQIAESDHDKITKTDAIVVLTGGSGRLAEGLDLLKSGLSKQLFVSGVAKGLKPNDVFQAPSSTLNNLSCCITFDYSAQNTSDNAKESALWIKRHNYKSLRLVTGNYHMPRSIFEFRKELPNTTLIANPIYPEHVKIIDWWYHRGTARLIASEYAKSLLIILKI